MIPTPLALPNGSLAFRMLPGPIPFEAIDRFATRYRIVDEAFDRLLDLIHRMDAVYREMTAKE